MRTSAEIVRWLTENIDHILCYPAQYGETAEQIDNVLWHNLRTWAYAADRENDLSNATAVIYKRLHLDTAASFSSNHRAASPNATDKEVLAVVLDGWRAICHQVGVALAS